MAHVLLVDDDPDIRELVALALDGAADLTLTTCADAAEAEAAFRAARPDIVVLDVNLPDRPGAELFAALRAAGAPAPPMVFLTANTQRSETERLRALGAGGIITKPFDVLGLAATLRGFLGP